jgi:hypothetical protein
MTNVFVVRSFFDKEKCIKPKNTYKNSYNPAKRKPKSPCIENRESRGKRNLRGNKTSIRNK